METLLVSACLVGESVRYDATALRGDRQWLGALAGEYRILPFCPEVAVGLPVPRACVEIVGGNGYDVLRERAEVRDAQGRDLSAVFRTAAEKTLEFCSNNRIRVAILTENSPSCGRNCIYDGSFSGRRKAGAGVTAALLVEHGVAVFSQDQIEELVVAGAAVKSESADTVLKRLVSGISKAKLFTLSSDR